MSWLFLWELWDIVVRSSEFFQNIFKIFLKIFGKNFIKISLLEELWPQKQANQYQFIYLQLCLCCFFRDMCTLRKFFTNELKHTKKKFLELFAVCHKNIKKFWFCFKLKLKQYVWADTQYVWAKAAEKSRLH